MNKKFYLFAAAAAVLSLTACSSDDDAVQANGAQTAAVDQAVSFDTYVPNATRAGDPAGVMTTDKMKTTGKGFGVFAMFQNNDTYANLSATITPNFMFNEHVHWAGGWTYSPLKYWPNETTNDSQTTPASADQCDKLSFFAYAPYVDLTTTGTMTVNTAGPVTEAAYVEASPSTGILAITKEDKTGDPLVEWKANTDALDEQVDLLWGVAPAGMAYQSVNPSIYVNKTFGLPLTDMVKPDKDQKIKFLFQHALSRIGLSVVSAIDQIAAGDDGDVYNNDHTRVLIKSVEVYGDFGKQGVLNLNNTTANVAKWIPASIAKSEVDGTKLFDITAANGNLNADLRYVDTQITAVNGNAAEFANLNTGVLPSETPLFAQGADPNKLATGDALNYAFGKALYTLSGSDYVRATTTQGEDVDAYTKSGDIYTQARAAGGADLVMNGTVQYYKLGLPTPITVSSGNELTASTEYYVEAGSAPNKTYTKMTANGSTDPAGTYYLASSVTETALAGADYSGTCYTGLVPRYFMVIPTGDTPIKIKITYAVVTKDEKLTGNISNVENEITKSTSLTLESGKSYNLKLILGLTSVKLDATVADWQVADDLEINLPRNNE